MEIAFQLNIPSQHFEITLQKTTKPSLIRKQGS